MQHIVVLVPAGAKELQSQPTKNRDMIELNELKKESQQRIEWGIVSQNDPRQPPHTTVRTDHVHGGSQNNNAYFLFA